MSAFGLNPLNPKCGPLIPLDTSKYDTLFKNNPSKIQCERLKVPYLFLPPDTNTLKNYDKDQFSFTFIENGIPPKISILLNSSIWWEPLIQMVIGWPFDTIRWLSGQPFGVTLELIGAHVGSHLDF